MAKETTHLCSECNQPHKVFEARKLGLDRQKIDMLRRAAEHVKATGSNRFKKADLNLIDFGQSAYGNWQATARFGLIAHATDKDTKKKVRGVWLITPLGWYFLRGQRPVKSWVMVKDGHVQHQLGYGPELMLQQIYKGADTIQTNFEYYDDDNNMVGFRPGVPAAKPEQASLL